MLYESRYYSKALMPVNPGNSQVPSALSHADASRMRIHAHATEPSTPEPAAATTSAIQQAAPEKAMMLPTMYGMPAAEMANSFKGRMVAEVIDHPGEDGPRRMAIERAIMEVRGKSSNQVRSTFVPESAAPLVDGSGRATTRTQMLAMRRAELEAANAHIGRDRQTTLPKGVQPGAPGKRPDATRFTYDEVLMGSPERGAYLASGR